MEWSPNSRSYGLVFSTFSDPRKARTSSRSHPPVVTGESMTQAEMGEALGGYDKGVVSRAIQKLKEAGEI